MTTKIRSDYQPANDAKRQPSPMGGRYINTYGHGFNAATTDIIRTTPKSALR